MSNEPGMVIVGTGEAGTRAAGSLRERGYAGSVIIVGDDPHGAYERPPLCKAVMSDDAVATPPLILDDTRLTAQGVEHLGGVRASAIDRSRREVRLDDGRVLSYSKLLIATGAGPRRLSVPGGEADNLGRALTLQLRSA